MRSIEEELARLQRAMRLLQGAVAILALVALVAGFIWAAPASGRVTRVRALEMVNDAGDVVAALLPEGSGAVLRIRNGPDSELLLGDMGGTRGLALNRKGVNEVLLAGDENSGPTFSLKDASGATRLLAGLDDGGVPVLVFRGDRGRPLLYLGGERVPRLWIKDAEGKMLFEARTKD